MTTAFADLVAQYTGRIAALTRKPARDAFDAFDMVHASLVNALADLDGEVESMGAVRPEQVLAGLVSIAAACELAATDLGLTRVQEQAKRLGNN